MALDTSDDVLDKAGMDDDTISVYTPVVACPPVGAGVGDHSAGAG